jgi:RNA polymerase sigma-70 factor (ECF subfamily)
MSVEAAVRQLPDRQREAIILVHYQDMSNIEAAKVLEVSVEALESLLARGRRNLRQSFGLGAKNNE